MEKKERRPGDPYEVGFGKPPKRTHFKKGRSGNPKGRPPKKPDLYSELTKVLRENVTITVDGQPEKVTVQQALLLRLRDQALRGELWAEKLLQKVVGALPESGSEHEPRRHADDCGQVLRSAGLRIGSRKIRCGVKLSGNHECRVMTAPSATRGHRFTAAFKRASPAIPGVDQRRYRTSWRTPPRSLAER